MHPQTSVRFLAPEDAERLGDFFERLASDGSARMFHPHPMTRDYASALCRDQERLDLYFIALYEEAVIGYGMLRGWDEGYDVPALGVAVDREARGKGVGRAIVRFGIDAARARGATRMMLKVYPDNTTARALYESEGFVFSESGTSSPQLIGILDLGSYEHA